MQAGGVGSRVGCRGAGDDPRVSPSRGMPAVRDAADRPWLPRLPRLWGRILSVGVRARYPVHWSRRPLLVFATPFLASRVFPERIPTASTTVRELYRAVAALGFVGSGLPHELAHTLAARRLGLAVASISLYALGSDTDGPRADQTTRGVYHRPRGDPTSRNGRAATAARTPKTQR
jgi:hypothetical protein